MLLYLLVGYASAQLSSDCLEQEFESNGRFTGQNIDMNYEASELLTQGGATQLKVQFFVPKRYVAQYEANAFAITFNRDMDITTPTTYSGDDAWKNDVTIFVDQAHTDQSACYSNRYDNYTYCENPVPGLWTIEDNDDNACISDVYATIPWADVMGTAFQGVDIKNNGEFTEVFLTATVETWTHFVEGDAANYLGTMTGAEQWQNTDVTDGDTNKLGEFGGDGGWRGVGVPGFDGNFGPIPIDDERYTLYQIPFILRFPRTVVVETSFRVSSPITVLTGILGQDVITIDLNPSTDGVFAVLEATLTTQVQYPFGIRSPEDDVAPMTAVVGGSRDGGGTHAASIEFVEFDDESGCGSLSEGEVCEQTFKVRITPAAGSPCTVAGDYFFEFWAECVMGGEGGTNGCSLDDNLGSADDIQSLERRRTSNAYFSTSISIAHQPFCPLLMDEVRVVGDLRVYHDEAFETEITQTEVVNGPNTGSVFTNDRLYFEATYRTASNEGTSFTDFEENDFDGSVVGDDSIIDYVRSTKIFMDVTIGEDKDGDATESFSTSDWDSNFQFELGGSRIPGTDISGSDITVTTGSGSTAVYQIVLCEVDGIDAEYIQFSKDKPLDCFTAQNTIANDFLDFTKMIRSATGSSNTIDENEVAFQMRMDERIIPLKPKATDGSFVKVTVESEIYYKGNRHPSRRLLQVEQGNASNRQNHSMATFYRVFSGGDLAMCTMGDDTTEGTIELELTFTEAETMPTAASSLDWASRLSLQLETYLGARDVVSVERMEQCNEQACSTIYSEGRRAPRRRLDAEATYLKVALNVASTTESSAGHIMNQLQANLVNTRSDMNSRVSAFAQASVTNMRVPGCGESTAPRVPPRVREENEIRATLDDESSAFAVSSLLATLVGIWALF